MAQLEAARLREDFRAHFDGNALEMGAKGTPATFGHFLGNGENMAIELTRDSLTRDSVNDPLLFDWADVIGRIALAWLFLWSGYLKLAAPAATVALMQTYGMPAAHLLVWPALLLELGGGAALALGWKARWVGLVLAVYTLAATFVFHAYWSVPARQVMPQEIHFVSNLAITGGLLLVFAHGAGRYALDKFRVRHAASQ